MTSAIDFLPTISSCQAVSQINRATARWAPHAGYDQHPRWVSRNQVEPTAGHPLCAFVRKRKFPEHDRLREAFGRPTDFEPCRSFEAYDQECKRRSYPDFTCGAMDRVPCTPGR